MKTLIQNSKGEKIAVLVEEVPNQKGLAFVMHGLGGNKEQQHIKTLADAWKESGYTVVLFDARDTFGESEGNYEDATITSYYEDLETVIAWAKTQKWYREPFALAGHSLGGICVALYAEKFPREVMALAPISTVVSGRLSLDTHTPEDLRDWEATGWRVRPSRTMPGVIKRLKWSHLADRLKYDLLPEAGKLTMPVFLLAGELDDATPPEHQKMFFDAIPGSKEIHTIAGAPHTFIDPRHLAEIKELLKKWIRSIR